VRTSALMLVLLLLFSLQLAYADKLYVRITQPANELCIEVSNASCVVAKATLDGRVSAVVFELPPGRYLVKVSASGRIVDAREVELPGESSLEFDVAKHAAPSGTVREFSSSGLKQLGGVEGAVPSALGAVNALLLLAASAMLAAVLSLTVKLLKKL